MHTDALGSPVARSNAAGGLLNRSRYEPYGYVAQGTKPSPATSVIGFTGHVQDAETDLVYMQQRYYDPIAGRFLSVDPVVTDTASGQQFGRYHYAENNPYRYTDPTGRLAIPLIPVILEAIVSAIASKTGAAVVGGVAGVAIGTLATSSQGDKAAGSEGKAAQSPSSAAGAPAATGGATPPPPGGDNNDNKSKDKGDKPASEKTAKDIAKRIERDLGKDARRDFHDAKESGAGDRTLGQLKQDARDLYIDAGKEVPKWLQ